MYESSYYFQNFVRPSLICLFLIFASMDFFILVSFWIDRFSDTRTKINTYLTFVGSLSIAFL